MLVSFAAFCGRFVAWKLFWLDLCQTITEGEKQPYFQLRPCSRVGSRNLTAWLSCSDTSVEVVAIVRVCLGPFFPNIFFKTTPCMRHGRAGGHRRPLAPRAPQGSVAAWGRRRARAPRRGGVRVGFGAAAQGLAAGSRPPGSARPVGSVTAAVREGTEGGGGVGGKVAATRREEGK